MSFDVRNTATTHSNPSWHHDLLDLVYADKIECVHCEQVFDREDKLTPCPNSSTGTHGLVPNKETS